MNDFERIKMYYDKGWATKAQVARYVSFGKITSEEYTLITGDAYAA
ncbi:XkdX family protein [Desulfosporosinus sp.]|nr:XkdX family protein [Desulfosporosinus sp.]MBC2722353.1 XkdX family protein [Desulfosporosinus sp.]MBC2728613.1 XkdX family protein [Desulfosporosinus sp.]